MSLSYNEFKDKNVLYNTFGMKLKTKNDDCYNIKKVYLFKNGKIYIIANYFYDNFRNSDNFVILGDVKRKLKEDLNCSDSFVLKSGTQYTWEDTKYDLYININNNEYECLGLDLCGTELDIKYTLNGLNRSQCIGWNDKKSSEYHYHILDNTIKKLNTVSDKTTEYGDIIKELAKKHKEYLNWLDVEKTYTEKDYEKMRLVSGTGFIENYTMLVNNGYEVSKKLYDEEVGKENE